MMTKDNNISRIKYRMAALVAYAAKHAVPTALECNKFEKARLDFIDAVWDGETLKEQKKAAIVLMDVIDKNLPILSEGNRRGKPWVKMSYVRDAFQEILPKAAFKGREMAAVARYSRANNIIHDSINFVARFCPDAVCEFARIQVELDRATR